MRQKKKGKGISSSGNGICKSLEVRCFPERLKYGWHVRYGIQSVRDDVGGVSRGQAMKGISCLPEDCGLHPVRNKKTSDVELHFGQLFGCCMKKKITYWDENKVRKNSWEMVADSKSSE